MARLLIFGRTLGWLLGALQISQARYAGPVGNFLQHLIQGGLLWKRSQTYHETARLSRFARNTFCSVFFVVCKLATQMCSAKPASQLTTSPT